MVGLIDIDEITHNEGELGYWLDEPGLGPRFRFRSRTSYSAVAALNSGHAADNPASARVLARLGFRHTDDVMIFSHARATDILQRRYRLEREAGL